MMKSISSYEWEKGAIAYNRQQQTFFVVQGRKKERESGTVFLTDGKTKHAESLCSPASLTQFVREQPCFLFCGGARMEVQLWDDGLIVIGPDRSCRVRIPGISHAIADFFAASFDGNVYTAKQDSDEQE